MHFIYLILNIPGAPRPPWPPLLCRRCVQNHHLQNNHFQNCHFQNCHLRKLPFDMIYFMTVCNKISHCNVRPPCGTQQAPSQLWSCVCSMISVWSIEWREILSKNATRSSPKKSIMIKEMYVGMANPKIVQILDHKSVPIFEFPLLRWLLFKTRPNTSFGCWTQ